jgi:hypothetical protein
LRGRLDLANHKLAGLYRKPAKPTYRTRMEKCPDEVYYQLWHLADGAVRDCFACHPEYLTPAGKMSARRSLVKRITGTMYGYATQVAWGGYETPANVAGGDSAEMSVPTQGGADNGVTTLLRGDPLAGRGTTGLWRRICKWVRRHLFFLLGGWERPA